MPLFNSGACRMATAQLQSTRQALLHSVSFTGCRSS
ncbi:hypothetical protein SLEP1_g50048 [Rubroshorea leprosula]|uniref:Uncharacterized protein n=1 Tax=Rubroshorea leprosula TaxID=152421 RepID=A0AAV5LYW8_9ROSI|nr:hypothetical protein SLEP1_g50048 [Rubroshorea leprosula]